MIGKVRLDDVKKYGGSFGLLSNMLCDGIIKDIFGIICVINENIRVFSDIAEFK